MRRQGLKMCVIGGGSSYTPELIDGLIRHYDELPVGEIVLCDTEAGLEKQDIVASFALRMIERANVPIRLHTTLDRREAIRDADFVTTQFRVGLLEARAIDERIPLAYGCIGQETSGAGGFAKALRTIPVILDICRDMEELAPGAFLLNFTNPAGLVTEAVLKYARVRCIGLCNLPLGVREAIARFHQVPASEVEIEMVGINHLNWTTKVAVGGMDVTERLLQQLTERDGAVAYDDDLDWDPRLLRSLGAIPCGYHKYYYMKDEMLKEQMEAARTVGTRAQVVQAVERELFELYRNPNLSVKPPQLDKRGGAYYSEVAVRLMNSIHNNKHDLHIVNVRNGGAIPHLPDDAVVEVNCVVDSHGARPVQIRTPMTAQRRGLLQVVKAYEELTVEAAVKGDYNAGLQALTIHPLVGSATVARKILDDILSEHRRYLPQFA